MQLIERIKSFVLGEARVFFFFKIYKLTVTLLKTRAAESKVEIGKPFSDDIFVTKGSSMLLLYLRYVYRVSREY